MDKFFKIFVLSLAIAVPVVLAGTNVLSSADSLLNEKKQVLQLLYNLCLSGKVPEVGLMSRFVDNERSHVYCRQQAAATLGGSDNEERSSIPQTIFLQSPSLDQRHRIVVNATTAAGNSSGTKVYVVPPNIKNRYSVEVIRHPNPQNGTGSSIERPAPNKPAVFFIGGNGLQSHNSTLDTNYSEEGTDDGVEYEEDPE